MNILVTGGAGYIGSHTCKALNKVGHNPITLDSLERGHEWAVKWGPLYIGTIHDQELVRQIIKKEKIEAVFHFAAYAYVAESMADPQKYFYNNTEGTKRLLEVVAEFRQIHSFIFSSSCVVYGTPESMPVTESTPLQPINPYGASKVKAEALVSQFSSSMPCQSVILRYFNACGADPDLEIGAIHDPETRVIPLAIRSAFDPAYTLQVFGDDYATPDGTCIRDYIHVTDLAEAHVKAFQAIRDQKIESEIFNLGTQVGVSVWDIIEAVEKVTGQKVKYQISERRVGDPPELIANVEKVSKHLYWKPRHSQLEEIVRTAVGWYKKAPH